MVIPLIIQKLKRSLETKEPRHFSYTSKDSDYLEDQMSCYMTYTNTVTHDIIRAEINGVMRLMKHLL